MKKRLALQAVLLAICLYHVVLGVGAFLSEDVAKRLAEILFSVRLELTPQLDYVVKLLGIYAFMFGLMTAVAARAPERHPVLLNLVIVLYACRILNKLVFADLFTRAFAAPPARAWIDVAMLAAFGLAVALLKPRGAVEGPA
jgi:hypothetical protein